MSFNTFCGQDETNAATYQRVLLRFQEGGGGGGGVASVNNGTNINITGPAANPIVNLDDPLTAQLNLGAVDVLDTAGAMGAAGTVLSSLGAGNGTSWVVGGGGAMNVQPGVNIDIPNPALPVVNLQNPLTAVLNIDIQNITGTTASITLNDATVNSQLVMDGQQANYIDNTGVFYSRMEVGGFSVVSNASDTRLIAGTLQNTNGAVLELLQSVVGGDIQLNCNVDTDEVITNCNLKPFAITDTAASSRGLQDNVLCSLGAAGGTRWTEINRACISYSDLINAPTTIRPIDDGTVGPAELTNGNFSFTVSQLYDPLVPFGTTQILTCEIFYQANFEKALFNPQRPLSSTAIGVCVLNEDGTSGPPFVFAPTQITFVFDYEKNGVPTQFDERVSIGQSTLTYLCPQVLALIPTAPTEAFAANVHLIGNIDCAALNPADTIAFRLRAFTSFGGLTIDTTTGANYFGQIGIKCYMSRS